MRVYIYSRKSVWTGKGESIENQVEMCRRYIAGRIEGGGGADITVYEDEGFSGKNLDRPQLQRMLADSRREKPDYIVCYRLDRISRSVGDFAPLAEDLIARGIGLICIREQFDTSTPMGKAMMYIASVFAQLERETIAERVRDNMLMLARTGRWLGGPPPTGFFSEQVGETVVDKKAKTLFRLREDPAEIGAVKLMFQKYLELRSLGGVAKHLTGAGVCNRSGRPYSPPGIKDILRNPVYCTADRAALDYFAGCGSDVCFSAGQCSGQFGLLSYNKRSDAQKGRSRLDKSQWIVAVGRHPGIISGADWVKVQQLLEERAEKSANRPVQSCNDYSLLSGLIFCSRCGARMLAKRRSNSETRFDYLCKNKLRAGGPCNCQNLGGQQADRMVLDLLAASVHGDGGIVPLLEALKKKIEAQAPQDPAGRIDARMQQARREMAGLMAALASAGGNEAVARHVSERIEALDGELGRLAEQAQAVAASRQLPSPAFSWPGGGLREGFAALTIHEKRDFIRLFVQRLEWDGRDLHLYLYEG